MNNVHTNIPLLVNGGTNKCTQLCRTVLGTVKWFLSLPKPFAIDGVESGLHCVLARLSNSYS